MNAPAIASQTLGVAEISRMIEMAWEDRTPFESIEVQFGPDVSADVTLMRRQLKRSSFKIWREQITGRATKHAALRSPQVTRHRASHTRQA